MKTKSVTKRVLSVILCTVMLFSCWVFTAPGASAQNAGNYDVRVSFTVTGTNNIEASYSGFESAKGDSAGITIRCLKDNGVSTTTTDLNWDIGKNGGNQIKTKGDYTLTGTAAGFPAYIYLYLCDNYWFSGVGYKVTKLEVKGTSQSTYTTLWSGTMHVQSKTNGYGGWLRYDGYVKGFDHGLKNADEGSKGDDNNYINTGDKTGWLAKFPYRSSGGTVSASNITLDGTNSKTSAVSVGDAKDQYNVNYATSNLDHTAMSTPSYNTSYITYSGDSGNPARTVTATKDAHIWNDGINSQNVTVTAYWKTKNTTNTINNTTTAKTITITDEKYTYTWNWKETNTSSLDSPTDKSTTAAPYYGDTPSIPTAATATTAYYTSSKHWSGGSYTTPARASAAKSYTMTYSVDGKAHSYTYAEISGNHSKHKGTCSCGYSPAANFDHTYGDTTFTFATDGKTATVSRTCTTTGCNHIQSQTVTCTSAVKTAATCTEKGWTTYTATSPFSGDTATDSVDKQDIDASGHSWNPTTFTFSEDGTTAKATRVCKNDKNHTETQNATMSHAQKTAPTCTEKGWNTYTATSPFAGDTASATNDVQDIPAIGHDWTDAEYDGVDSLKTAADCTTDAVYFKVCSRCHLIHSTDTWIKQGTAIGHSWNPATFTFSEDGTTATATRVCKNDSNHTETQNATMSHAQKTAPTCTEKGWNTYTATSPFAGDTASATNDVQDIPAKGHAYGDWADDGADNHKKVCANDPNHVETEAHTFSTWSVTVPEGDAKLAAAMKQDYDASAECFRYCTKCYRVEYKAHNYTSAVTKEATCTEEGVTTSTCEFCNNSYTQTIAALGHNYVQDSVDPLDGGWDMDEGREVKAYQYFYCDRCNESYCPAKYINGAYVVDTDPDHAGSTLAEIEENVEKIPTPLFNYHVETFTSGTTTGEYPYSERSSSFKLMKGEERAYTGENTKQDFRFSGSVQIPVNISYKIGTDTDNVITDFGYVYSQDSHIGSDPSLLVLNSGDSKIASLSVVGDKKTTNPVKDDFEAVNGGRLVGENGAWSGVSYFYNGNNNYYELTFNLVISIRAKNWKLQYAARPYVKYLYHGVEYTVYDGGRTGEMETYSHSAVFSNVVYGLAADAESPAVQAYCMERIIPHHNDFYPSTFETEERIDEKTDWWQKLDIWEDSGTTWEKFRKSDIYQAYIDLINPDSAQS